MYWATDLAMLAIRAISVLEASQAGSTRGSDALQRTLQASRTVLEAAASWRFAVVVFFKFNIESLELLSIFRELSWIILGLFLVERAHFNIDVLDWQWNDPYSRSWLPLCPF